MNDPLVVSRSSLGQLEPIGKGMTAKVYRLPDYRLAGDPLDLVYKEYKKGVLPGGALAGLLAIVRVRDKMEPAQQGELDKRATWPLRVVEENGVVKGVLMRLIPGDFFGTRTARDGSSRRQALELQFLLQERAFLRRIGLEFLDARQRLQVLKDFAHVLAMLHKVNIVYGDISLLNAIYRGGSRPGVMLVDCDAVRVAGTSSPFIKQPHSPDFDPPEALANGRHLWTVQSSRTDVYKFGLVFLRVLSVGVPQTSMLRNAASVSTPLPGELADLLERTLATDPAARPPMREWYHALAQKTGGGPTQTHAQLPIGATATPAAPAAPRRIGAWERQPDGSWTRAT